MDETQRTDKNSKNRSTSGNPDCPSLASDNPHATTLDALLSSVTLCAEDSGIDLWLECGTLLGFVREGDYIAWEEDLDFGASIADIEVAQIDAFTSALAQRGYQVTRNDSYWHIAVPDSVCHADINLYTFRNDGLAIVSLKGPGNSVPARAIDSARRIVSQRPLGVSERSRALRDVSRIRLQKICRWLPKPMAAGMETVLRWLSDRFEMDISWRVPADLIADCRPDLFRNVRIHVPANAEEYLAFRYGTDWRKPREAYDTWKEDGAIV